MSSSPGQAQYVWYGVLVTLHSPTVQDGKQKLREMEGIINHLQYYYLRQIKTNHQKNVKKVLRKPVFQVIN